MFNSINITNNALNGTLLRMEVISENVAHADTPGYKRRDVSFQNMLEEQIQGQATSNFEPEVYVEDPSLSLRMDGNNVDIDREMSEMAKTQLRYDTLIQRVTAQLGRYSTILQSIK